VKILEHRGKELFSKHGIPIASSRAVTTAEALGLPVVVKARIDARGRGKGGGITLAQDEKTVCKAAERLLGHRRVRTLFIEAAKDIGHALCFAATVDRARRAGRVDSAETAKETPDAILKEWVELAIRLRRFQVNRLARTLSPPLSNYRRRSKIGEGLSELMYYVERSAIRHGADPADVDIIPGGGNVVARFIQRGRPTFLHAYEEQSVKKNRFIELQPREGAK